MKGRKHVVITGASKGIGRALVKLFVERGSRVIAISRDLQRLEALADELGTGAERLTLWAEDICEDGFCPLVAERLSHLPKVDILINNAGYLVNKPFEEITSQELLRVYDVNVLSVFRLIQTMIPFLSEDAHVVNVSSMGGFQGSQKFPGLTAYSSSKAAICGLTECLQEEYKDSGFSFKALCLGAVQTEMLEAAFPGFKAPLQPEEMATYIAGFADGGHRYFRGKVLPVSSTTP
ncbi:MAG: SDR family oxidoreductase [Bacteroidota bacterium]|nr:SDR family oxidoreductase [Bacteroidota bacterium]MDX5506864.1 SDR family oxidoreductase [Bacteroidota bacterium]